MGVAGVPGGSLREPGGTPAGEAIRDVLLHRPNEIAPWTEALLYAAARAQLVSELLRPSLEAGLIVVLDRYVDSSLAYQGFARGLGIDAVLEVNQRATGGLLPDLTLLLRVDPERAARRAGGPPDRLEAEGRALQARVAAGYDELARRYPERIVALRRRAPGRRGRGRRRAGDAGRPRRADGGAGASGARVVGIAAGGVAHGAERTRCSLTSPDRSGPRPTWPARSSRGAGHAYLLAGPEGLGKRRFALELGAASGGRLRRLRALRRMRPPGPGRASRPHRDRTRG